MESTIGISIQHAAEILKAEGAREVYLFGGYPWLERDDIRACLEYAHRLVGHERIEPLSIEVGA